MLDICAFVVLFAKTAAVSITELVVGLGWDGSPMEALESAAASFHGMFIKLQQAGMVIRAIDTWGNFEANVWMCYG